MHGTTNSRNMVSVNVVFTDVVCGANNSKDFASISKLQLFIHRIYMLVICYTGNCKKYVIIRLQIYMERHLNM